MDVMEKLIRPLLVAFLAMFMATGNEACRPPGQVFVDLEKQYNDELLSCVADAGSVKDSCWCRVEVDRKWGLCPHEEWPRISPCDGVCE